MCSPTSVCRAGCYCLQYSLTPELPNGRTLRLSIDLEVTAGPPVGFDIQVRSSVLGIAKTTATPHLRSSYMSLGCSGLEQLPKLTLHLVVQSPPPAYTLYFLQGEGRAIAMSKAVLLGEALPPLRLVFQDSHGNTVPVSSDATPAATLQVLEAGPGGGGVVLQELQALADAVSGVHCTCCSALLWCQPILPEWPGSLTDIQARHSAEIPR